MYVKDKHPFVSTLSPAVVRPLQPPAHTQSHPAMATEYAIDSNISIVSNIQPINSGFSVPGIGEIVFATGHPAPMTGYDMHTCGYYMSLYDVNTMLSALSADPNYRDPVNVCDFFRPFGVCKNNHREYTGDKRSRDAPGGKAVSVTFGEVNCLDAWASCRQRHQSGIHSRIPGTKLLLELLEVTEYATFSRFQDLQKEIGEITSKTTHVLKGAIKSFNDVVVFLKPDTISLAAEAEAKAVKGSFNPPMNQKALQDEFDKRQIDENKCTPKSQASDAKYVEETLKGAYYTVIQLSAILNASATVLSHCKFITLDDEKNAHEVAQFATTKIQSFKAVYSADTSQAHVIYLHTLELVARLLAQLRIFAASANLHVVPPVGGTPAERAARFQAFEQSTDSLLNTTHGEEESRDIPKSTEFGKRNLTYTSVPHHLEFVPVIQCGGRHKAYPTHMHSKRPETFNVYYSLLFATTVHPAVSSDQSIGNIASYAQACSKYIHGPHQDKHMAVNASLAHKQTSNPTRLRYSDTDEITNRMGIIAIAVHV